MNSRTIVIATSAALVSFAAVAADEAKKRSQGGAQTGAMQSQSASGATQKQATSDEQVKQAQQHLSQMGYDPGPVDGILGPKTQAALKKLQEDRGLKQTGQLNAETLAQLETGAQRAATPSGSSAGGTAGGDAPRR